MSLTTTANFDVERTRRRQRPILLLEIQLTGETLYLANRGVQIAGQWWSARFADGVSVEIDASFDCDGRGIPRINSVPITLVNAPDNQTSFSDLLATRTLSGRRAILRQGYLSPTGTPLAIADCLTLIDGTIRLPDDLLFDDRTFRLEIVDGTPAWHGMLGDPITAADFAGAGSDVLGKIQPIIYGTVNKHQCIPVDIGARTTLQADITTASTSVILSDASAFPASGSIYIDGDEIAYTGKSTNTLTGATGIAAAHERGATVVEKQAAYDYLIADHAVKAINAVYIRKKGGADEDWVRLDAGEYTAYASGGGGIASKANIRFSSPAFLARAVALAGTAASHTHTYTEGYVDLCSVSGGYPKNFTGSAIEFTPQRGSSGPAGFWRVLFDVTGCTAGYEITDSDGNLLARVDSATPSSWIYAGAYSKGHIHIGPRGSTEYLTVTSCTFEGSTTGTNSGSTSPSLTLTGQDIAEALYNLDVAVDVDGYADTAGGTYTGTGSALIIRPSDQLRHIGCVRRGWTLADRFDSTTFDAARTLEASNGMRMDFAIREQIDSAALFDKMRHQSMSAHTVSAGQYKRYVHPFTGSSVHTFTEADDLVAIIGARMTPLDAVQNVVGLRYCPDPWTGDWRAYTEAEDTDSQGTGNPPTPGYGKVARWVQEFDLIRDATAAEWARDAWLAWLKDQKYEIDLALPSEWIHLEPWDRIAVTSARMPGGWTAKEFLIVSPSKLLGRPVEAGEVSDNQADDRIVCRCREA